MTIDRHLQHSTGQQPHADDRTRKAASYKRGTEASARVRHAAAEKRRQEREQQEASEG